MSTGKDFYEAGVDCANKGGQLCSWSEWTTACHKGVLTDVVFGSLGTREWLDGYAAQGANVPTADPRTNSDCTYPSRSAPTAADKGYRCCAS